MNASVISSVLNEGMIVSMKLGSDEAWHSNIVYKVNGNSICLTYMAKFMKSPAVPGCTISIKYSNTYFFYYFSGIVEAIRKEPRENILAQIDTAEEMINNRLFPRYDVFLTASLKPVWDDESYQCTVTDLSYGGAAFVCPNSFDSNEQLEMSLCLPDGLSLALTGKVIVRKHFQSNTSDYAIQFDECSDINSKLLTKFLSQLEEENTQIYNRYISEIKKISRL